MRIYSGWKMPGNGLLQARKSSNSPPSWQPAELRFAAIPIAEDTDLAAYGLASSQKPLKVKLTTGKEILTLTFGDPTPGAGDTSFTKPAYVRVNDLPEVLQLAPTCCRCFAGRRKPIVAGSCSRTWSGVRLAGARAVPDPFGYEPVTQPPPSHFQGRRPSRSRSRGRRPGSSTSR